jgi:hypothetical protein
MKWSDDFARHMIAKGSITPPPATASRHLPRWYWPTVILVTLAGMAVAFWYGVYFR